MEIFCYAIKRFSLFVAAQFIYIYVCVCVDRYKYIDILKRYTYRYINILNILCVYILHYVYILIYIIYIISLIQVIYW